jgi:DNA N-6-adenine-methyltransferase Dam
LSAQRPSEGGLKRAIERQVPLVDGDIDEVGDAHWLTPPWLMERLDAEFHFDFDACPYPRPAGFNSLNEEWGKSTWVNPPVRKGANSFSEWVHKAVAEHQKGKQVVMILPFPRWMRELLQQGAEFRFPGVIHFLNPKGKPAKSEGGGRIPDILVILKPKSEALAKNETDGLKALRRLIEDYKEDCERRSSWNHTEGPAGGEIHNAFARGIQFANKALSEIDSLHGSQPEAPQK